ncbi:MAG TPA: M67 family metallopeptidase [Thermoplasmata archaeon]|nr:M67 family metallopeptidase [Thermoplasmata archaeon]
MNEIRLAPPLIATMEAHARATYPDECCGMLIGPVPAGDGPRIVEAVEPAANEFEGERRRRFVIPPEQLRATERRLEASGRGVVGFYHSHPDHPARPSTFDRDHAWPWYAYLVLGVRSGAVDGLGAFELDPESGEFAERPIVRSDGAGAGPVASGKASA